MSSKYVTKKIIFILALFYMFPLSAQINAKFTQVFKVDGIIWGFDFIGEDKVVYSLKEKGYYLYEKASKKHFFLGGVADVYIAGQGGYLDIKLHPQFATNNKVIFSYSKKAKDKATTAVAVAVLQDNKLTAVKDLFVANADTDEDIHFGGRLLFNDNDSFFVSVGDRNERADAQNLKRHNGKIMRINMDGTAKIWSYGHRNPQGLSFYEKQLWSTEFGPRGGDELNKIVENGNYGWPVTTKGREYWGPKIGVPSKEGMIEPIIFWVPSISPSGLHCYQGEQSEFKGKCLLANLSGEHIRIVDPKNINSQQEIFKDLNLRFRQIMQDHKNVIHASTDEGVLGYLDVTPTK